MVDRNEAQKGPELLQFGERDNTGYRAGQAVNAVVRETDGDLVEMFRNPIFRAAADAQTQTGIVAVDLKGQNMTPDVIQELGVLNNHVRTKGARLKVVGLTEQAKRDIEQRFGRGIMELHTEKAMNLAFKPHDEAPKMAA